MFPNYNQRFSRAFRSCPEVKCRDPTLYAPRDGPHLERRKPLPHLAGRRSRRHRNPGRSRTRSRKTPPRPSASAPTFSVERIHEIEAEVKHDVIAFTTAVAEIVGPHARWFHYGLTSNDVVDTAQALLIQQASEVIAAGSRAAGRGARAPRLGFKDTPMIGRTHGIHAEPITFGLKLANWYSETQRNIARFTAAAEDMRVGKFSGAVGTFAHLTPELEEKICARLGLKAAAVSSQVIQRDRHAHYLATLAVIASTLDKIATEIRHLQRTEVREAEEFFSEKQKGSSAMPHKRNPVTCEQISGLARVVRCNAQAGFENVALWHERDISHSSVERVILPDSTILTDYLLHKTTNLIDTLFVYPERMRRIWKARAAWSSAGNCCSIWSSTACRAKMLTAWCSRTPCAPGKKA